VSDPFFPGGLREQKNQPDNRSTLGQDAPLIGRWERFFAMAVSAGLERVLVLINPTRQLGCHPVGKRRGRHPKVQTGTDRLKMPILRCPVTLQIGFFEVQWLVAAGGAQ